jgi:hypothetical protein
MGTLLPPMPFTWETESPARWLNQATTGP